MVRRVRASSFRNDFRKTFESLSPDEQATMLYAHQGKIIEYSRAAIKRAREGDREPAIAMAIIRGHEDDLKKQKEKMGKYEDLTSEVRIALYMKEMISLVDLWLALRGPSYFFKTNGHLQPREPSKAVSVSLTLTH